MAQDSSKWAKDSGKKNHTGRSSFGKSVDIFGNGEEAKVTEWGTKEKGKNRQLIIKVEKYIGQIKCLWDC